jgi:hypothetical protein
MHVRRKQFKALFAQRGPRARKHSTSKLTKITGILPIGLSVAAFCLSLFSFYTTGLRVTDDLRVVVGSTPLPAPDFEGKRFILHPETAQYVFINAGTRSAIISGIQLAFAQPQQGKALPEDGCQMEQTYEANFPVEPLVVKPGEMISTDVKLPVDVSNSVPRPLEIPFSSANEKSQKVRFRLCIDVSFTTPSVEYGIETVSEFEDELDRNEGGYLFTRGDRREEHRPVQLVKGSTIVFFD